MDREDFIRLCFMEVLERLLTETGDIRNLGAAYSAYLESAAELEANRTVLWGEAGFALAAAANQTA